MKRAIVWSLFILLLLTGCQPLPPAPASGEEVQQDDLKKSGELSGEITDPAELERLWQDYIYDALPSIGNALDFHSAEEIRPEAVAQYCWYRYLAEHGPDNLETVSKESTLLLFPLKNALEYAARYFNLENLDVSKIPDYYYNPQKRALTISSGRKDPTPSYTKNPFGFTLDKVTRDDNGTVTVKLINYSPIQNERIEHITTFTLKQRKDGSLYFVSGEREYINNHLVSITGDITDFPEIKGINENMQGLTMIGEVNGKVLLHYNLYDYAQTQFLIILDPATMTINKQVELKDTYDYTHFKLNGLELVVALKDKILILNQDLEKIKEIPLPQIIRGKMDRDPQYNRAMIPQVVFRGYDISDDYSQITYADETGVKLYRIVDNSEKMLSATPPPLGPKEIDQVFHASPRFVAHDKKVISSLLVYEGLLGYTLCDLEEGTAKNIELRTDNSTRNIHYDTGLLNVNMCVYADSRGSKYQTVYLDFQSGKVTEIKLERPGDTGFIRNPGYGYVGQNHAAFITTKSDPSDSTGSIYYLNRLDLRTMAVEQEIISVKAVSPYILGVLGDGRIIFSYYLNPSEKGICISSN